MPSTCLPTLAGTPMYCPGPGRSDSIHTLVGLRLAVGCSNPVKFLAGVRSIFFPDLSRPSVAVLPPAPPSPSRVRDRVVPPVRPPPRSAVVEALAPRGGRDPPARLAGADLDMTPRQRGLLTV